MKFRRVKPVLVAVLGVGLLAAGCGDDATPASTSSPSSSASTGVTGALTVFAAASLTDSFNQIGKGFEAANPGVDVTFSFAGSSALATQIVEGAPADVFAAASAATMKTVTDAGDNAGEPTVFVRNQLVIAVPDGNPAGVTGLDDLTKPDVKVALCAAEVPCGAAAVKALDAAGIELTPVTLEQDVKSALAKVELGEVDAALVYRTDAQADADKVDGIEFPESAGAVNDYPIVALADAPNPDAAEAFVEYVLSEPATAVLTEAGFQKP